MGSKLVEGKKWDEVMGGAAVVSFRKFGGFHKGIM